MAGNPSISVHELFRNVDPSPVWERLFAALPDVVFRIKDLGFRYISANQSSFTRQFHGAVGQPPAAYRAMPRKPR